MLLVSPNLLVSLYIWFINSPSYNIGIIFCIYIVITSTQLTHIELYICIIVGPTQPTRMELCIQLVIGPDSTINIILRICILINIINIIISIVI